MNQQDGQNPAVPATLWDAADELNRLRDALVELGLAMHDWQFELEDDTSGAARERALSCITKASNANVSRRKA